MVGVTLGVCVGVDVNTGVGVGVGELHDVNVPSTYITLFIGFCELNVLIVTSVKCPIKSVVNGIKTSDSLPFILTVYVELKIPSL